MFKITEENKNGLEKIKIVNTETGEYVSVLPQFGGNVNGLVLLKNNKLYSVLAGNNSKKEFEGFGIYNGAKLFPFPNRIKDGVYIFEGKEYQLQLNYTAEGNAAHGLVYNKRFRVLSKLEGKHFAEVNLIYNYKGMNEGYPFPFELVLTFTLIKDRGFICKTVARNKGGTPMPFGDGWHPFLSFRKKIDNLFLKFDSDKKIITDDSMIPTGKKIKYDEFSLLKQIGKKEFDDCFLLKTNNGKHETVLYDEAADTKIILCQETGKGKYNYLHVYTPPGRKSIAVEPVTSNINAFNNKEGLNILQPQEKFVASYGIYIK